MVAIVRTEWDGTSGGPGLTQMALIGGAEFTAANAQSAVNAVRKFWQANVSYLPDELRLTVSPVVDIYRETDAELIGSVVAPVVPVQVIGISTQGYAGGAGIKLNWNTGVIRNGRRVKGSTFIVPIAMGAYGLTGTPLPATANTWNTAAQTLMADLTAGGTALAVWSRPLVKDQVITRTGSLSGVLSGTLAPKSAILRGRRD
jgi:hypothetical protein